LNVYHFSFELIIKNTFHSEVYPFEETSLENNFAQPFSISDEPPSFNLAGLAATNLRDIKGSGVRNHTYNYVRKSTRLFKRKKTLRNDP
jgi:hypothetical protein